MKVDIYPFRSFFDPLAHTSYPEKDRADMLTAVNFDLHLANEASMALESNGVTNSPFQELTKKATEEAKELTIDKHIRFFEIGSKPHSVATYNSFSFISKGQSHPIGCLDAKDLPFLDMTLKKNTNLPSINSLSADSEPSIFNFIPKINVRITSYKYGNSSEFGSRLYGDALGDFVKQERLDYKKGLELLTTDLGIGNGTVASLRKCNVLGNHGIFGIEDIFYARQFDTNAKISSSPADYLMSSRNPYLNLASLYELSSIDFLNEFYSYSNWPFNNGLNILFGHIAEPNPDINRKYFSQPLKLNPDELALMTTGRLSFSINHLPPFVFAMTNLKSITLAEQHNKHTIDSRRGYL